MLRVLVFAVIIHFICIALSKILKDTNNLLGEAANPYVRNTKQLFDDQNQVLFIEESSGLNLISFQLIVIVTQWVKSVQDQNSLVQ